jgi:hypothetical protein
MTHFDYMRLMVKNILRAPYEFSWSVQGLGMMRVYLSREVRLHIWDSSLRVPGVSALHTHPWDLKSTVIAGVYKQHRYLEYNNESLNAEGIHRGEFNKVLIQCGENACTKEEPVKVTLIERYLESFHQEMGYSQASNEIHLSVPEDGTMTLVERTFKKDTDHAFVYWRGRGPWVDAKPREATREEIAAVTTRSLETWF